MDLYELLKRFRAVDDNTPPRHRAISEPADGFFFPFYFRHLR